MIVRDAAEQTVINVSAKFAAGGSATAVGSGAVGKMAQVVDNPDVMVSVVTWADVGVVCGIIVGGGGLIAQIYFHWRRDRRESRLFKAQMNDMKQRGR